jgi:2-desacetyl-2-hydroxyethyl bacteriochlorophyllide A dehydrogenase
VSGVKTAIIYGPRDIRVEEVEVPTVGPRDVLIHVGACGICGSDVHRYLGDRFGQRLAPYPLNSGHEYCGVVTRVGEGVRKIREGDRVTLGLNWVRDGMGAFSEYLRIPSADERPVLKVPDVVTFEEAAQIEPLVVALNGFHGPKPRAEDKVLILGAGPIGLSLLEYCLSEGVKDVTVCERSPKRVEVARSLGAKVVDVTRKSLEEYVEASTNGVGVDVAFECAGAAATTRQALSLTKRGGRVMLIAHYGRATDLDPEEIVSRSLIVYGYGNYLQGPELEALRLIVEGKVRLKSLVSHEFPLVMAKEAFEVAAQPDVSVKVLIRP